VCRCSDRTNRSAIHPVPSTPHRTAGAASEGGVRAAGRVLGKLGIGALLEGPPGSPAGGQMAGGSRAGSSTATVRPPPCIEVMTASATALAISPSRAVAKGDGRPAATAATQACSSMR
jgi:hypothetical protein